MSRLREEHLEKGNSPAQSSGDAGQGRRTPPMPEQQGHTVLNPGGVRYRDQPFVGEALNVVDEQPRPAR